MEKKKQNVLLLIMGLLVVVEFVITVSVLTSSAAPIFEVLYLIALAGVAVYGFWLYKKPHGNLLKYSMLLCALTIIFSTVITITYKWNDTFIEVLLPIFSACAISYVAGRLSRIEQNKYLLPIIAIILLIDCVIELVSISSSPSFALIRYLVAPRKLVIFITLMIAYFVRYKEHKEAGLMDAPKN